MTDSIMAEVSPTPDARARKMQTAILQRLANGGQARVATAIGVHESTVSRAKDDLERLCQILAHLGFKVVDVGKVCVPAGELTFLRETYHKVCEQAPWLLEDGSE